MRLLGIYVLCLLTFLVMGAALPLGDDVIAAGTQNLGAGSVLPGTCVRQFSSALGAASGQVVAWTYSGTLSVSDLRLTVYPEVFPDEVTWYVCNETPGTLFRSGNANVNWRLLP